jgi:hypothetical protein
MVLNWFHKPEEALMLQTVSPVILKLSLFLITAVRLTARGVLEWADLAGACGRKWVVSI